MTKIQTFVRMCDELKIVDAHYQTLARSLSYKRMELYHMQQSIRWNRGFVHYSLFKIEDGFDDTWLNLHETMQQISFSDMTIFKDIIGSKQYQELNQSERQIVDHCIELYSYVAELYAQLKIFGIVYNEKSNSMNGIIRSHF